METEVGSRRTRQRQAILEALRSTKVHPDAQWVYEQVRKNVPRISLGTVYRNLDLLSRHGVILQVPTTGSYARFDGDTSVHGHIICRQCQRIDDLWMDSEESRVKEAATAAGYRDVSVQIGVYGLCPQCPNGETPQ